MLILESIRALGVGQLPLRVRDTTGVKGPSIVGQLLHPR